MNRTSTDGQFGSPRTVIVCSHKNAYRPNVDRIPVSCPIKGDEWVGVSLKKSEIKKKIPPQKNWRPPKKLKTPPPEKLETPQKIGDPPKNWRPPRKIGDPPENWRPPRD